MELHILHVQVFSTHQLMGSCFALSEEHLSELGLIVAEICFAHANSACQEGVQLDLDSCMVFSKIG